MFEMKNLRWTNKPENFEIINDNNISITTQPYTDLWQKTYYHFSNDNAPILQTATDRQLFSFTVKTNFDYKCRFDQCGIIIYFDSYNWLKASVEFDYAAQHLGSVLTLNGYSDWATTEIDFSIKSIWYRLSRRMDDFRIEYSYDGTCFRQMRICHLSMATGEISYGIYACSPENSSFKAIFTDMQVTECSWPAHDGQPPDY